MISYQTYPEIPEIPESKKDTWVYLIVYFDTPTRPDTQYFVQYRTRPDIEKPYPLGTDWHAVSTMKMIMTSFPSLQVIFWITFLSYKILFWLPPPPPRLVHLLSPFSWPKYCKIPCKFLRKKEHHRSHQHQHHHHHHCHYDLVTLTWGRPLDLARHRSGPRPGRRQWKPWNSD